MRTPSRGKLLAVVLALSSAAVGAPRPEGPEGLHFVPEAERSLRRVVIGLPAADSELFLLPTLPPGSTPDPRRKYLAEQLYWLLFELLHGRILDAVPTYSQFFVAVPEGGASPEGRFFLDYVKSRLGWSPAKIAERIRIFPVSQSIVYPQDMAEPLGYDARERLILGVGSDSDPHYLDPVESLVRAYPNDFVLRRMPGINTEGGDLALVRLPEGEVGLLVGRNRLIRYVGAQTKSSVTSALSQRQIEAGRNAYRRAFFGLEVLVPDEDDLRRPAQACPELFHLDMFAAVLKAPSGVVAFVPTFAASPIDALGHVALDEAVRRRVQDGYDRAAGRLERRGFRTVRIPFADHPARNPVGVAKFLEPGATKPTILLARYPYHLDLPDGRNPLRELQEGFQSLDEAVAQWLQTPGDKTWEAVRSALRSAWTHMDASVAAPNPVFQEQRRLYEVNGIRVVPVPIYPTGEGGIHCLVLK